MRLFVSLACLSVFLTQSGEGLSCYQCRSDEIRECGDPFIESRVGRKECDTQYTQTSIMCYKTTQFTNGELVTVRGCSSFDTQTFPEALQRAMAGDYWKGDSVFSICDYAGCNRAPSPLPVLPTSLSLSLLTVALLTL